MPPAGIFCDCFVNFSAKGAILPHVEHQL
jgi:hypothetical protein